MLKVDGVTYEDDPLVLQFLGQSMRCGAIAGGELDASLLDFLKLRTRGLGSPPFRYEVRHDQRDNDAYVVVREEIRQRDGSQFPGAPGFVDHTYYYNAPVSRFELVDSTPEDPDFNRALLRELGNPLGFMALHWEAVCNGALYLHRARTAASGPREQKAPDEASAPSPPTASGLGQWPPQPRSELRGSAPTAKTGSAPTADVGSPQDPDL